MRRPISNPTPEPPAIPPTTPVEGASSPTIPRRRIIVELAPSWVGMMIQRAREGAPDYQSLDEAARDLGSTRQGFEIRRLSNVFAKFSQVPHEHGHDRGFRSAPLVRNRPLLKQTGVSPRSLIPRTRPDPEGLAGFFAIDVSDWPREEQNKFLEALQSLDGIIQSASFEPRYRGASRSTGPTAPAYRRRQTYLRAVGARVLRSRDKGVRIGFADLDAGWDLDHQALRHVKQSPPRLFPRTRQQVPLDTHGTAVLGIIVGGPKIQGIARGAVAKALICPLEGELVQTLLEFLDDEEYDDLNYGDILLIELEQDDDDGATSGLPIEVEPAVFKAIRLAVSMGVVVIEAAGNGTRGGAWDFDQVAQSKAKTPAWSANSATSLRSSGQPAIPDSGAIIVSGCDAPDPGSIPNRYDVDPRLNFGSAVDCFGWGGGVTTAGEAPAQYIWGFDKTSAAAAMVAGVALEVQRMAATKLGYVLSPGQLRALLRDPACGTPVFRNRRRAGVVPHLGKIRALLLRLPRVKIRAYDGDNRSKRGSNVDVDSQSPDIVLCREPTRRPRHDPAALRDGQAAYLYVQVTNLGDAHARDVRCTAYWSARNADPDAGVVWHELEESRARSIRRGRKAWLGPIAIPEGLRSDSGNVDILVSAGARYDPRPLIPPTRERRRAALSRSELLHFLRANVSTAMRTVPIG